MTMFLVLGVAASVICLVSFVSLVVSDSSEAMDDHEGF